MYAMAYYVILVIGSTTEMRIAIPYIYRYLLIKIQDKNARHYDSTMSHGTPILVILKMKSMNLPEGAIRQKMMKEGFLSNKIDSFFDYFNANNSNNMNKKGNNNFIPEKFGNNEKYSSIIKLKNLKEPELALRHRMKSDGFSQYEIDDFFKSCS